MTYDELVTSGQLTERQLDVYQVLLAHRSEPMTATEIERWMRYELGYGHSGVHSRLRELEALGMARCVGRRRCAHSRHMANIWEMCHELAG